MYIFYDLLLIYIYLGSTKTFWNVFTNKLEKVFVKYWLREMDLNQRPSDYEPDELPGCSIPQFIYFLTESFYVLMSSDILNLQLSINRL
jgi:hypothetical protein